MTAYRDFEALMADPAIPDSDKAEIQKFASFLAHHGPPGGQPGSRICACGIPARLEGDRIVAVPNPDCECPCHSPGYAVGR